MADFDNIELRSEKIRNIIGKVPPRLIRVGITDIAFILSALILAAFFVPYPESVKVPVVITGRNEAGTHAQLFIPYRYVTRIKNGMKAEIEMEGYEAAQYGYAKGQIENCSDTVAIVTGNNYFIAEVLLQKYPPRYSLWKRMKGTASILISDESIASHILPHW